MADAPTHLRVHFDALSGHDRHSEVDEPPIGPIAPAIAKRYLSCNRTTPARDAQELGRTAS